MKLLVAVSSKHGSTREIAESIAESIAETIRELGIEVDVADAERVESVGPYDAVVVGSALYMGRWMGPARALVNGSADAFRTRPVWLFSSGPMGRDIVDPADAAEGKKLLELVGGRDHRVFAGKADQHEFGFVERQVLRMVKSPYGDYRDWAEIREWADGIAQTLTQMSAVVGAGA
jgi:menaquinone-dependent protoporphyrinogen oxidase